MDNAITWHSKNAEQFDGNYARRRAFGERYDVWTDILDRYSHPERRVLDIGCGSGVFSLYAAGCNAHVLGVDGSREMIELCDHKRVASEQNNVSFVQAEITSLADVVPESVDLIICSSVLEYVDDLDGVLRTIGTLVTPGGVVAISMPNPASLYRRMEPVAYKLTGRPKYYGYVKNVIPIDALVRNLAAHGLAAVETRFFSKTRALAPILHRLGLAKLSDNLYVVVARRAAA